MTLATPVRGAKPDRAAAKALADRYIARDGKPPSASRAPKRLGSAAKAHRDRQYVLTLIGEIEADLKVKAYARAKASLKILRKAVWEART